MPYVHSHHIHMMWMHISLSPLEVVWHTASIWVRSAFVLCRYSFAFAPAAFTITVFVNKSLIFFYTSAVSISGAIVPWRVRVLSRVRGVTKCPTQACTCHRPSDQPRDAARWEECSGLYEKSLTTFCCCDGRAKGLLESTKMDFYET